MVNVKLNSGVIKEYDNGTTIADIAKSLGADVYKSACAAKLNGNVVDLRTTITEDCNVEILTFEDEDGKKAYRHTASHILAQAVKKLYPNAKLAIGPAIKDGFYYDFDIDEKLTPEHFSKIEKEMKRIVKQNLSIERFELPREDALALMHQKAESYKEELINDLPEGETISFYQQGDFVDLCAGPHLMSTGKIKALKLTSVAGAYWRGNENNKMLQRIYGTAFSSDEELSEYINKIEEAKKRDHRKIGQDLQLFTLMPEGPGFPFFLPNGMVLRNALEDFWREIHAKRGYKEIKTPIMLNQGLWHQSGHWDHYKDNMYTTVIDDTDFALKPMNCPGSILVYKNRPHSYKEFPLRVAELGLVHRHENSGNLHGLMRVRCFTQDDAHIFMLPEQIKSETAEVMRLINDVYGMFGFKYHVELSTRPEDSMGTDEQWELATESLKQALSEQGVDYIINEGDGAFYGPKIDFHLEDCLGRTWQCGTIQLDFQMPERFEIEYVDRDGQKRRPVMIHRVVLGSIERFIGILTEHQAGNFSTWLAPVQVRILPIADKHLEYANEIANKLTEVGVRVEVDHSNETFGKKMRNTITSKIPYAVIIGDKELEEKTISVKNRDTAEQKTVIVDDFIKAISNEIHERKVNLNAI